MPAVEIQEIGSNRNLASRALAGEVIVVRRGLQQAGLLDEMLAATYAGVRAAAGAEVAERAAREGLHRIHDWVEPEAIPALTDAVYAQWTPQALPFLDRLATWLFPDQPRFYFEREPNVRFHIPYDLAAGHRRSFDQFAKKRGQGKIAAHAPHRDYWLDCPDNAVNLWIALGPVVPGNGLTLFPEMYDADLPYTAKGEVTRGVRLGRPITFDLAPGDIVLFHSKHLHGSEVNRTDSTRSVVSFRVTFEAPRFPLGHYHDYCHAGWQRGALRPLASWPARMQASYFRSLAQRARRKLFGGDAATRPAAPAPDPGRHPLPLAALPVGEVRAVSKSVCVARLAADRVVALARYCPHGGADLADGHVDGERVVCPWHNLEFDAATGESACAAFEPLRRYAATIRDGEVHVALAGADEA